MITNKNIKLFLSGIFTLIFCISLHAEKALGEGDMYKNKTELSIGKDMAEKKLKTILSTCPLASSALFSFCLLANRKSNIVIKIPQTGYQFLCKVIRENISLCIQKLYFPERRQKLSIAAIQCGVLTSFGANFPPLPKFV
jgi:hypothetical protein